MEFVYIILALIAGTCAPTQAGINSRLSMETNSHVLAALISFLVGTIALWIYSTMLRIAWPESHVLSGLPWWIWTGGVLGAFFVAVTIFLAPKLGATTLMASLIAGQMIASLFLDHYGLLGFPLHATSLWRLGGAGLIVAGVMIIRAT
jgi:transporter family-2 protein